MYKFTIVNSIEYTGILFLSKFAYDCAVLLLSSVVFSYCGHLQLSTTFPVPIYLCSLLLVEWKGPERACDVYCIGLDQHIQVGFWDHTLIFLWVQILGERGVPMMLHPYKSHKNPLHFSVGSCWP